MQDSARKTPRIGEHPLSPSRSTMPLGKVGSKGRLRGCAIFDTFAEQILGHNYLQCEFEYSAAASKPGKNGRLRGKIFNKHFRYSKRTGCSVQRLLAQLVLLALLVT